MHGSGGQTCKHSRHMWPVSHSPVATVASNSCHVPNLFSKDGHKIRVGDCALFKPPLDYPPFIGIIRRLSIYKEESITLDVNWLYRPADIKITNGSLLEAVPNEVFYSFHKDEISAKSLLHPCKVAFLHKGVELPRGLSSFVCRRVYDIENRCLWWLTDKDFINERQEEVDKLLDKTRLEMHGGMQPGGRSPRPLNGPASAQFKSGSDSIQNSTSSSFHVKGKKRERGEQGSASAKRECVSKMEDGESGQIGLENMLKSEIAIITEKGGLVDFGGVERLVQLMQPDTTDKKIDLAGKIVLVDVIAVTDRFDCLGQFVELGGLSVLDDWLQEVHNGKIGDSSSSKESDKSVDEFLLALLRALDKLPVNLRALQKCNVGRSVNQLRTHKNYEIQKKVKSLVDTWKKRVGAEMNMNDAKTGSGRVVSWSNNNKPSSSEVSQAGSRKTGSSTEVGSKNLVQHAVSKTMQVRHITGEVSKTSASLGATKTLASSARMPSNDQNSRTLVVAGGSDIPLSSIKDERSSSSSQSQNNSQSSDHIKTLGSSCREDAKSSTAGSPHVNKTSRHRKSGNVAYGSAISGDQKDTVSGRFNNPGKGNHSENSSAAVVSHDRPIELAVADHGNNRLIVRLPNTGCSPARGVSGGSLEDQGAVYGRVSPTGEKHDNHEKKHAGRSEAFRPSMCSDVNSDACQIRDELTRLEEGEVPSVCGEWHKPSEDGERSMDVSKAAGASPKIASRLGKSYEASLCSINALIESCVKFSEANASVSPGDDIGMNLLASVATGEICKSNNASPSGSPCMDSPVPEVSSSGEVGKLRQCEEVVLVESQSHVDGSTVTLEQPKAGDLIQSKAEPVHLVSHSPTLNSGDTKGTSLAKERAGGHSTQLNCSSGSPHNIGAPPLVSDNLGDPYYASIAFLCSGKESFSEAERVKKVDEQRKSGSSCAKRNNISVSELKTETPLLDNVKKECYADERTKEDSTPVVLAAAGIAEVVMGSEKPICSTLDVGIKSQDSKEELSNDIVKEQKSSHVSKGNADFLGRKNDDVLLSASVNATDVEFTGEQVDDYKAESHTEQINEQIGDICPASEHDDEPHLERKLIEAVVCSVPVSHDSSPSIPLAGKEKDEDSSRQKSSVEMVDGQLSSSMSASRPDASAKLDFDLNEGFPVEDGSNGELPKVGDPGASSAVHLPCQLPIQISSISSSFPTSITVAAPAKGPFVLPKNLLQGKREVGWRGSAATSAFRPAEPRKNLEPITSEPIVDTSTSKPGRTPLDFDLNVPHERAYEDIASQCAIQGFSSDSQSHDRGAGGLDLDLNRVDENLDAGPFSCSNYSRLEIPPPSGRSSLSSGLSNGGINASRDFDLNNGPGLDDLASETAFCTQPLKGSLPLSVPISGIRASSAEFGNFSPWYPGNSFSAITIPSVFPNRTDHSYVAPSGSQRVLCPGSTPFGPEMYRGPVLSSSPAVAFPPTPSFQYPGFPFETNFPLSSHTFSGGSKAYMDSSSGGTVCFPTISSQLIGPAGVLSSSFPRPYVMNIPGPASNVFLDGSKWTSQGLDLNTGPGNTDTDRRDERLPSGLRQLFVPTSQALVEEQLKMFQVGGVLKRKEPDGGLDPLDRISYKQHSWQ